MLFLSKINGLIAYRITFHKVELSCCDFKNRKFGGKVKIMTFRSGVN